MNPFENAKIYKLENDVDDEVYVGYTCQTLEKRMKNHLKMAKHVKKYNDKRKVYVHLNEIGWEHVKIVLIENVECDNEKDLKERERYWIETLEASLNKKIPGREAREYREDNKDKIVENAKSYYKAYYEKNKEKINKKSKELIKCECGDMIMKGYLRKHKKTQKHAKLMLKKE